MQPNLEPGEDFQFLLDKQVREMQEKAAALTEAFADSAATVSSRDGSVTVTVTPNGGLRGLELGHRACDLGPARLTAAIMETVRTAQRQTARSVADSFVAINGEGATADLIRRFLPVEDDAGSEGGQFAGEPEPEPVPPHPAPPVPAPAPPAARRPRPAGDSDEDEMRPW